MATKPTAKLIVGALFLCAAAAPIYAAAQSETGTPNLTGLWARGAVRGEVTFLPVPGDKEGQPIEREWIDGPDVEEIVAAKYDNPILQPWVREIVKKNTEGENKLHSAKVKPSWFGESVGHYEGDIFVVDTIGLKPGKVSVVDNYGTPHTDKLHVTERYRVINDEKGKGLEVIFRVEDPGAFTMPWKGMAIYRPNRATQIDEVVCAENDRSFAEGSTFGDIPVATKADF